MTMTLRTFAAVALLATFSTETHGHQQLLFDFQSAFWVNLHQYLHALARNGSPLAEPLPDGATPEDQQQWRAAVESYRTRYGRRSLLFDEELVRLNWRLGSAGSAASLANADVPQGDRAVLEAAAPVYRRLKWPEHDRANRQFITTITPLLERHGNAIAARLAAAYDTTWPKPIRADVVHDAGPPGNAYTTNDPTHITIAARDPRHQGFAMLELVFHEASHGWDALLMREVDEAAKRLGVRPPPNLWHELLFFNAGAITADVLRAAGVSGYRMYAVEQRVFSAPDGAAWLAIAKHWPLFLSGQIPREQAIAEILRSLRTPPA